jgi:uncharacterized membrane protein YqaE (UPF0057 family)
MKEKDAIVEFYKKFLFVPWIVKFLSDARKFGVLLSNLNMVIGCLIPPCGVYLILNIYKGYFGFTCFSMIILTIFASYVLTHLAFLCGNELKNTSFEVQLPFTLIASINIKYYFLAGGAGECWFYFLGAIERVTGDPYVKTNWKEVLALSSKGFLIGICLIFLAFFLSESLKMWRGIALKGKSD